MRSKCINRKNNIGLSPLIVACERNLPSTVELLLNYGADINIRDGTGRSPLAVAAFCGCNDVVDFLLVLSSSSSSLMNVVDDNGCTPLWLAARTGNLSMVKRLVDAGADASIKSNDEMAPLDVAIKFKKERVVEFLSQRILQ
jgi:ankyrin repeat protein